MISNLLMLIDREAIMRKSAAGKIKFHSVKKDDEPVHEGHGGNIASS